MVDLCIDGHILTTFLSLISPLKRRVQRLWRLIYDLLTMAMLVRLLMGVKDPSKVRSWWEAKSRKCITLEVVHLFCPFCGSPNHPVFVKNFSITCTLCTPLWFYGNHSSDCFFFWLLLNQKSWNGVKVVLSACSSLGDIKGWNPIQRNVWWGDVWEVVRLLFLSCWGLADTKMM